MHFEQLKSVHLNLGRMGLGRASAPMFAKPDEWPAGSSSGKHHSGTTRMASTPKKGVIDSNCMVFGVDNLFVTGSFHIPNDWAYKPYVKLIAFFTQIV